MPHKLDRPAGNFDSAMGLLALEHFQMAYVTNDMDQARDLFCRRLGVREFCRLEGPTPEGGFMQAEFAWVGTQMYELICARGPGSGFYMDRLAGTNGFALAHHHLGFLVRNAAQWETVQVQVARHGFGIPRHNVNPLVEVCFVTVPGFAHYFEYMFATPLGIEFFEGVPRS